MRAERIVGWIDVRAGLLVILACTGLFTGCFAADADLAAEGSGIQESGPVVIAVIDSGTNPYLPVFSSTSPLPAKLAELVSVEHLAVAGSIEERMKADEAFWGTVTVGRLYHFEGTRLLSITFTDESPIAMMDSWAHGAYVTQVAALDAPNAIIVSVQVDPEVPNVPSLFDPSVASAMEWVADQPWIDIVSISLGFAGNPPTNRDDPETARWLAASERAARAGKIIVNAAGNHVAPATFHYVNGVPWAIDVGGVEAGERGDKPTAAKGVDVVSDFNVLLMHSGDLNKTTWKSGTSFAAPRVAATLASALADIRHRDPERAVTAQELRNALNATAIPFAADHWRPIPPAREDPASDLLRSHSLPVLLQPQMGWGYVNASFAPEIARRVIEEDSSIPPGKEQAQAFQPLWQQAREEYWSRAR